MEWSLGVWGGHWESEDVIGRAWGDYWESGMIIGNMEWSLGVWGDHWRSEVVIGRVVIGRALVGWSFRE